MKKNLLTVGFLALTLSANAQVLCHVDSNGVFYVGENALVYNGGGVQTKGNGIYDIRGNVMVVGDGTSVIKTLDAAGTGDKTDGKNIILRLNTPGSVSTSTYGQLYINGVSQSNITAVVSKEFKAAKQGNGNYFQQIALPFFDKPLSELSTELNKTFGTTRFTQNEILKWDNSIVVSRHYTSLATKTSDPMGYYMLGSHANNLDVSTPPATWPTISPTPTGAVYTLTGRPYSDGAALSTVISNAGNGIDFAGGNAKNMYNERYNSYLQDQFQLTTNAAWTSDFGRNIYQFGNPFFTNLDLSNIGWIESGTVATDGNNLQKIWGIKYDNGVITTLSNGSTYSTGALIVTYDLAGKPIAGDLSRYMIKPMQSFVIKMRDNSSAPTLNFNSLRRFKSTARDGATGYGVSAARGAAMEEGSVKQLGVIGLDAAGNEIGRTYYAVSPNFTTGHQSDPSKSVQAATSGRSVLGTFEEDPVLGGYDYNNLSYLLYINEANEEDFKGKPVPLAIYNSDAKKLKFEVLENGIALENGAHKLSTGIGFFYKAENGTITEINQNDEVDITSDEYGLFYGANSGTLGTGNGLKPARTIVVYSPSDEDYVVQFDPMWKRADVKVYDMSGKLVIADSKINTTADYVIKLSKQNRSVYVVTIESENGEKVNTKIIK